LRLLNCGLQGKTEREREGGKERKRESKRDHGRKKRGEDRWRLERDRERLTTARRQVARSPLAADKVNFL